MGQRMEKVSGKRRETATGYEQATNSYRTRNCAGCPLATSCQPVNAQASLAINHRVAWLKAQASELLLSEEGVRRRRQRSVDVEPVFGQLQQNRNFKRFRVRGLKKVEIEMGLAAMAHNIARMAG